MITLFQISAAILLFFLINIIGRYAPTEFRYYQITGFLQTDEAPAFNFSFRVLTPVVFIIVLSTLLYSLSLDQYAQNIYLINIYYVTFRATFNIFTGRMQLVNWKKQLLYAICTITISYFIYIKFIVDKKNLLPDFSNLANELWIIILIFLYNLINTIPSSDEVAEKRKFAYINESLNSLKWKYGEMINIKVQNMRLKHIIYAIIIHENFNRPRLFRLLEYIKFIVTGKSASFGIMQVHSDRALGDKASVAAGIQMLEEIYSRLQVEFERRVVQGSDDWSQQPEYVDGQLERELVRSFNHCDDYVYHIIELADYINQQFYNNAGSNKPLFR